MNRTAQSLNTLCAALMTFGAGLALIGWLFHISVLTRLHASFVPTQFNSALCFLLYGLGLAALNWQWRGVARALAGAILTIGLLSLFEHLAGFDLGIDTLAGFYVTGQGIAHPGRIAIAATIAITCLGAALILFSQGELTERRSAILAALGSVAAAVGLGGFLSFAAQLQSTSGWVGFSQIGFPSATLCMLAGLNVLLNLRSRFKSSATWLPIPLGAGLLALLLTLTNALSADQDAIFSSRVEAAAQDFALESQSEMTDMFTALDRMANRWTVAGGTSINVWDADTAAYLSSYPGLGSIIWADPEGRIARIARANNRAPRPNARAIGDQALSDARRVEAAHNATLSRQAQVTGAVSLRNGGEGFVYISPLSNKNADDGFQVATIGMKGFFGNVHKRVGMADLEIIVLEDGKPVYASGQNPAAARWTRSASLAVLNNHWRVAVTPSAAFLAAGRSNLPGIFFSAGFVFVLLITASFFFALRWRQNANVLAIREQELERSEERYELAVRGSGVGLWDRDVISGALYLSPRVLEIMGFPSGYVADRNELLGRVHPHDIGTVGPELFRAVAEKRPYDVEGRIRRQDDTYIWMRLRGMPVFDADGTLIRVAGSLDDITALKTAEAAVKASEESFRTIMDSAPVGMALISPAAKLVKANKALAALTGYSQAELLKVDPRTLFPETFDEDRRQIAKLLSGEIDHYAMEQIFRTKSGKAVWVLANASLARNPDRTPQHIVKQLLDISERKEMDRMKSEFVSVVSHELRTPLTAIRGSLGLMATAMRDTLPPKALHLVEIGYRNSERLIALVNDILDMEKLAADRMPFELKLENLSVLAEQAVESTAAYAEKYKVAYLLENRGADLPVLVDPNRMAQVFANLLSNAAKFSPEGGRVRVVIRARASRARFEVIDHGPGISDDFKARIFGRFAQADSSITRAKGGTGLGLHITRELVEKMGGTIGFDSVADQGTKFWVEFPLAEEMREIAPSPVVSAHIPRVLHVEDDADLTSILVAELKGRVELVAARTLKEAQALLKSQVFAAVILDVGMPDGSGLSLIGDPGRAVNPLPVIILSAQEIDPALTRGAAAILVKSKIAESEIAQTVLDVLAAASPAAQSGVQSSAKRTMP
ncbi:MAG: PAS domain S-box protein [Rhizomicrobium sp.]